MPGSAPNFAEVVEAIFGSIDPRSIHVTFFKGDPHNKDEARWHGQRLSGNRGYIQNGPAPDQNHFICMGVLDPDIPGRSLANVIGHTALWMDDVGTKVPVERVQEWCSTTGLYPTAIFNTSPGNFSYVWALKDVVPADGSFDDQTVAAIRAKMKEDGWGDPAAQDAARYMRSGFGINGKAAYRGADGSPFEVKVISLDARERVSLANFALYMIGANWRDEVATGAYLSSAQIVGQTMERNASMDDPLVKLAMVVGLDPQPSTRHGVIDCRCPNEAAHTHGDPTGYAFINKGMSFCNHASCGHLKSPDFQAMIEERYDQMIADGLADGTICEHFNEDGVLLDSVTGERVAPDARTFLAAASFEGVGVDVGGAGGTTSVVKEAELVAARAHQKDLDADQKRAALFDRFVFVEDAETFWDRKYGTLIASSRLDKDREVIAVFGHHSSGDKRASVKMLNDMTNLVRVKTTTIKPFRADRRPNSDIVMIESATGPVDAINEFVPTSIGIKQGNVTPWLDHLAWMYGDQPDVHVYLLDMMAFFVQHPDVKISVIPVLVGRSGIGKDLAITDPLIDLLGRHNHVNVTAYQLANDFNEFLKKPLVHLGEFSMAGRDGEKIYDRMKHFSSTATLTATINPKYGKQYQIDVSPKFIGTTNNDNALGSVDDDDRRFFIARSNAEAKKGPGRGNGVGTDPYFEGLDAWLKTPGNLEAIHHYLLNRQITVFNPNAAPPRTAARHEVLVASMSAVAQFVYELVTEGDLAGRKVLTFKEIEERAFTSNNPNVRSRVSHKGITDGLLAAGCRKIDRVSVGGKRLQLWTGSCVLGGIEGALTEAERDTFVSGVDAALATLLAEQKAEADALAGLT